jgi:hypothetical protein
VTFFTAQGVHGLDVVLEMVKRKENGKAFQKFVGLLRRFGCISPAVKQGLYCSRPLHRAANVEFIGEIDQLRISFCSGIALA